MSDASTNPRDDNDPPLPPLPPLPIARTSCSASTNNNKRKFKTSNTVRTDSTVSKKSKQGLAGSVEHPARLKAFTKSLQQTGIQRIPEGLLSQFNSKTRDFLLDQKLLKCFNKRRNQASNCTCLKQLLQRNQATLNIVADIVTAHFNLPLFNRDLLVYNKIHDLMDSRYDPNKHRPSTSIVPLRNRIFELRGKFDG